ncbi:Tat proofreading chaperone DmsD [Raoultibacter phocaeensis]|uniref:Tat proofreading chaperone DmsD n=1 Tax=Raoultibacter phocaeensis TaxID=2479841 RepID=UPI0011199D5D|nr:Tat proofreading chaperone DmsD [Raoultibacter phocaeensis]
MHTKLNDVEFRGEVAFVGETLGPFFLQDPVKGDAQVAFEAVAVLEPTEAGKEWPFVADERAEELLALMVRGLEGGIDDDGLVWEYLRLFIGPAKKPAPPWGSVYTDRECVVFGESTLKLRRWMRDNGIERTTDEKTPEDHIGLMLVLLGWLAETKPELVEEYLCDHVLTWSSHFLDELAQAAEQPFYQGLALLAKESLEGMQRELALEVTYPRYYR